jgi:uncharacterized protein (TIGR00661 family)
MAKLLFGLSGDGMGHASRDKVIIDHLLSLGHEVKVVTSGKGYEFLRCYFNVEPIPGLHVVSRDSRVDKWLTFKETSRLLTCKGLFTIKTLLHILHEFRPDVTISDFEPFVSLVSHMSPVPLISVDNQHVITHCRLEYPASWEKDYRVACAVCGAVSSFAHHFFLTSFFLPEVKKRCRQNTSLVGPILRKEVLDRIPEAGNHILVYMRTADRGDAVLPLLQSIDAEFYVYGFRKSGMSSCNIHFKRSDIEGFLDDLAGSKAVITNGGHSLISEALYFRKPVYSIPTRQDFEQMINAYYLQHLGYGLYDFYPSVKRIQLFLQLIERFVEKIHTDEAHFNGNDAFFKVMDAEISSLCNIPRITSHIYPSGKRQTLLPVRRKQ